MITAFDASFCSRPDGSSQGGYFVLLAPRHILETKEDVYHILDWRSSKLPRVARSSLSAEAQAAGVASNLKVLQEKKLAASERRILDEEEQWAVQHDPPNEGEAYFVDSMNVLKYVNMVPTAAVAGSLAVRRFALQCLSIFWLCLAASAIPAAQGLVIETDETGLGRFKEPLGINMGQFCILMVCVISFCFGWYGGMRRQRAILSASSQALTMEVDELHAAVAASTNRANGLSIVLQATGMQLERVSAELRQATQAYQSAMNAAREHRRALQIAVGDLNDGYQARMDLDDHSLVCAMGHPVSIQDGTNIWHANEHCDQLYDSCREIREVMPCERCSTVFQLPRG